MLDSTDAQSHYLKSCLNETSDLTSAEVQTLESQLEAAKIQGESIALQQAQAEAQRETQISDLESKKLLLLTMVTPMKRTVSSLSSIRSIPPTARMRKCCRSHRSRFRACRMPFPMQNLHPTGCANTQTSLLALDNEQNSLQEQYNMYVLNTQTQVLTLMAQQEQAAAIVSSEKKVKNALGEQISLLEDSMQNDSSTATYYAAQVEKIDASIEDLDRKISLATVTAPNNGIVGAIDITAGQYLQSGTAITEVVDPSSLRVECMLLTDDANIVSSKTPARIVWERRDGDVAFMGSIQDISSIAVNSVSAIGLNEQRVKVVLVPVFEGESHPGHGYQVRVEFTTASQTTLAVPQSAVVQTDSGDAVYVVKNKKSILTPVTLGMESGDMVAVLSGLSLDDIVIRNPEQDGVTAGETVAVSSVVK